MNKITLIINKINNEFNLNDDELYNFEDIINNFIEKYNINCINNLDNELYKKIMFCKMCGGNYQRNNKAKHDKIKIHQDAISNKQSQEVNNKLQFLKLQEELNKMQKIRTDIKNDYNKQFNNVSETQEPKNNLYSLDKKFRKKKHE